MRRSVGTACIVFGLVFALVSSAGWSPVPGSAQASPWMVRFEESAEEAGLSFQTAGEVHGTSLSWPAFPEIAGVGACWADFDGDGYEDLYVANQRYNEKNPDAQGFNDLFDPTNAFFVNLGDGSFDDRTEQAGVESRRFDYGCSGVDYDADGHVDLLVYGFGHVDLYRNAGDTTFTRVTEEAGLDISTTCLPYECWTSCSAWADYDGDGWLDLFVCTFLESSMEDDNRSPNGHIAQWNLLFRNNGDGTFTEVAEEAGVEGIASDALGSKSWGAVWFDADLDGFLDLYVTNDSTPNEFYWNNRDGTFTRDDEAGLYDSRAGMGVTSGDTTNDGYPDLYFTHFGGENNGFYENRGDGTFLDRSGEDGLASDMDHVGWGTRFVDLDRDGHLDVVAVNGGTEWGGSDPPYQDSTLVYHQMPGPGGDLEWVDVSDEAGDGVAEKGVSRGAAFADHDLDGDVSIVVGNNANESLQFLDASGVTGGWFYVQPVQEGPNHEAIGARVVVEADGKTMHREIQAGSSFLSQDSRLADFGVGQAGQVDSLTVHWPDGTTSVLEDLDVDRVVRVYKETGEYVTDTLSPVTSVVLDGDGGIDGWFRSEVQVGLQAEDRAVGPASGVDHVEHRFEGDPWQVTPDDGVTVPAVEGEHLLLYRSVDEVGNREGVQRLVVGIDFSAPSVEHSVEGSPGSNGWWLDAEFVLGASDSLSGVDRIEYRIDGGQWQDYSGPVPLSDGVHQVEYSALDRAGNQAPVQMVVVKVDSQAPEVAFSRPSPGALYVGDQEVQHSGAGPAVVVTAPEAEGAGGVKFTVGLEAQDPTSGVDRLVLWLNDERVHEWLRPGLEPSWTWNTTGDPAGSYVLQALAKDFAGNVQISTTSLVLVPGNETSLVQTVEVGPSLYPFLSDAWWPGLPE